MEKFSVKKPFTVLVAVIMVLMLGFVSITKMKTNLLPNVSTPYLMVVTVYPGASPERVETEVSDVLQNALTVPGVSKITATSAENYSLLLMHFTDDTDMNSALVKVSNKLDQAKSDLPETALTPSVIQYSMNMNAFMTVAVSREGSSVYDLSDFIKNTMTPYVQRKGGVSSVSSSGLVEQLVQVQLNQEKVDAINEKLMELIDTQLEVAHTQLEEAEAKIEAGRAEYDKQFKNFGNTVSNTVMGTLSSEVGEAVEVVRKQAEALLQSVNNLIAVVKEPEVQQALIEVQAGLQRGLDKFNSTGMRDIDSLIDIVAELRTITDKLTTALQKLQERVNTETGSEGSTAEDLANEMQLQESLNVVYNTLELLNDEFVKQYKELRYGETNNVIRFFERELARVGRELREQEDSLRDYSVENLIINYDEQTKHIAILSRDFELRYEETRLNLNSSESLRKKIEAQLEDLQIFRNNAAFIEQLHKIGDLQAQITAAEAFIPDPASGREPVIRPIDVGRLQARMQIETDSLRSITSAIASQRYTKEGISTESLIQQWLDAVLLSAKSQAEMEVVNEWKKSLDDRYVQYAPVGSTLKRKNRLISFTEQSYLSMLQALNTARLRQKNLQMTSATLKIINPPVLPISAEPTKRKMMVAAAFFCTLVFLLGIFILLELLDRTLRDKIRAERITGGKVIGAFPGRGRFGERRFVQQYRQIASRFMGNAVLNHFDPGKRPNVLNILSTEQGDGKSTLAEHLAAHFRETGMKVRSVSWNRDFDVRRKEYLLAGRIGDFVHEDGDEIPLAEADVVIVEYPPLNDSTVSKELLQGAELNIVVAPANRTWKDTDQLLFEKCGQMAGETPTALFLNYAGRDVVQTFTGLLPPFTRLRRLGYQISQFGFTAVK